MCAIRESKDPLRTLDAFWKGQMNSKEWLIEQIRPYILSTPVNIDIYGGWVGTLASMLFQSGISIKHIRSIDIDSTCESTAIMMNKPEEIVGKFCAITADMCKICSDADVVINTSCEHITQDQYNLWLDGISKDSLIVLQSNNYNIPEHIRWCKDIEEFKNQSHLNVLWSGELKTQLYTRYMIIGKQ